MKHKKRYVQVYMGEGKGKTTAAAGLALRAAGAGWRVFVGQFIKGKLSHEMRLLNEGFPGAVQVETFGRGRFIRGRASAEDLAAARAGIERLKSILASANHDLVIADEAGGAVSAGLIDAAEVLSLFDTRPESVELVLTGRHFDAPLLERADLVTEMRAIKHYFEAGVPAREGIEF